MGTIELVNVVSTIKMASSGKPVVLVTGGSGYLGQFLVQALAKANFQVFNFCKEPFLDIHVPIDRW